MTATLIETSLRPSSAAPRRRMRLALLAAMIVMTGFLTVGWAAPASATLAPATATVCFKHTNGSPYTYGQTAQRWTASGWVNVASARSVNGCTTWTVASGYYWRFQAMTSVGRTYWLGTTHHLYAYAGSRLSYGTYWVYQYSY